METSIEHNDAYPLLNGIRGIILASRYLIEPCTGSKKIKLMHLARVDTKGHGTEWYNKVYGHICLQYLSRIKNYFTQNTTEGPDITL